MSDNNPVVQTVKITVEAGASPSFYFGCTFLGAQGEGWSKPKKNNNPKAELKAEREDDDEVDEAVELHTSPLPDPREQPQDQAEEQAEEPPFDLEEAAKEFNNLDKEILLFLTALEEAIEVPESFNLSNCLQEQKVELKTLLEEAFNRDDDDDDPLEALENKLQELTSS